MPHTRSIDPSGVLITRLSGTVTLQDLIALQNDMPGYAEDNEYYELVIHEEDMEILQDTNESIASASNMKRILKDFKRAAIAFVTDHDLVYGLCRQLQMRLENEFIQLCVFRNEETAIKWLHEIKEKSTGSRRISVKLPMI
jgi:hypothetical protein